MRAKMWDAKMDANTYLRQLQASKPIRIDMVAEYQAIHEQLISLVKNILAPKGLSHLTHEYMWYAEELYKASQTYSGQALQNKVNTIYVKYLAKNLDNDALIKIANFFGVTPDPPEKIFKTLAPMPSKCIIGFGESGFVIEAGRSVSHQPFSNSIGSSVGIPVPYAGTARNLKVQVWTNSLDNDCEVSVAINEEKTELKVIIPPGETGIFENNYVGIVFNENDRIYFIIDTTSATSGSIDIAGVTVLYEG
uniref:Uncharacterized protein n=2 Tax=cellular organisms TaxID=131567 RepID=A0A7C4RXR3_FERPE